MPKKAVPATEVKEVKENVGGKGEKTSSELCRIRSHSGKKKNHHFLILKAKGEGEKRGPRVFGTRGRGGKEKGGGRGGFPWPCKFLLSFCSKECGKKLISCGNRGKRRLLTATFRGPNTKEGLEKMEGGGKSKEAAVRGGIGQGTVTWYQKRRIAIRTIPIRGGKR